MTQPEFDDDHVIAICRTLTEHGVEFVVIGGVAARLHETGHATVDIDVCPSRTRDNLMRLADALKDLGARLRVEGDPEGVGFEPHPDLLVNLTTMTLVTRHSAVLADAHDAGLVVHGWTFRRENRFLSAEYRSGADPDAVGDFIGGLQVFLAAAWTASSRTTPTWEPRPPATSAQVPTRAGVWYRAAREVGGSAQLISL